MKKHTFYRTLFYITGLLILSLGLTLNTKAGLGVSPIISVSYSISQIVHANFGNVTLLLYWLFVIIELILHAIQKKADEQNPDPSGERKNYKLLFLMDVLQLPLSLVFTRFLNLFGAVLPDFPASTSGLDQHFPMRLLVLLAAIICTGIGAFMSLAMRIVPNPGDGIVQAIADFVHKNVGFTKNCFDLFNICLTCCIGLLLAGRVIGISVGTVLAMIGVGRIMALFLYLTRNKMSELSGVAI